VLLQKYFKLCVLLVCATQMYAQRPIVLKVKFQSTASGQLLQKNIQNQSFHQDTLGLYKELSSLLLRCNELSFLNATVDTMLYQNDTVTVFVNAGNSYKWVSLRKGNVSADILSSAGFRLEQISGKQINPIQFSSRVERLLFFLENNGYPFASVKLDSMEADSEGLSAVLNLQMHEQITFDTMDIMGDARIQKVYLYRYLGLHPDAPYSEELIRLAGSRMSQLPFLKVNCAPAVYFYKNKAMPLLNIDNRKASSVDGVVGFAPSSQSASSSDRLLITGEANLKLQNLFESGKSFDLNYRSFLGNSQDLKIKFVYPYIFNSNIALDYELSLLKQDTTFLDVRNEFGFQYRFIGTDYVKVFYNIQTTSIITVDTNVIKKTRSLPQASDITNNSYGIGGKITRLDYYLNPRKGFAAEITGGVGVKKIIRNPTIDAVKFQDINGRQYSVYDSLKLNYVQYRFQGNMEVFVPIMSKATIRFQANGGHIVAQNLFVNELFRIGGIRTLKGFDEQAIFASTYIIGNIEWRYLLQQNSNVLLFWNGAYYRNEVRKPILTDKPYGFGAGFNFESAAGIFSIYYAIGKEFNNPIDFNKAKVHFGYVNYF
jgi:outer membrane protein assembly factor BamA